MTHRTNQWAKKARQTLIDSRGAQCFLCKSIDRLEFAHVTPTKLKGMGRGRKERVLDVRKNPHAYVLLCHDCHVWYDHQ